MKNFVSLTVIVSLLVVSLRVTAPAAPAGRVPDGWLNGATSFGRAMQLQKDLNVPLVVYFYVDWCPYCHALEQEYFPSPPVRDYLNSVVKIKINPELTPADHELGRSFGIRGYPSFFVIGPGSFPVKVSPFRREGRDLTPAEFAQRCRDVTTPRTTAGMAPPAQAPAQPPLVPAQASAVPPPQVVATAPPTFVSNAPLPTVEDVYKRFTRLTGEGLPERRVTNRVTKGRVSMPGVNLAARFEFYSTSDGKWLMATIVDSLGTFRRGFDGKSEWTMTDPKTPGAEVPEFPLLMKGDLFREMSPGSLSFRSKLMGKLQEGDREVYLVELTPAKGPNDRLYFDVQTGLLLHRDVTRFGKRVGAVPSEIYFSNWRNVDGFLLPFTQTHVIESLTLLISVDEIKHNVAIDDAMFQRPIR